MLQDDAIEYLIAIADAADELGDRAVPVPVVQERCAREFGHSPRQFDRRLQPLRNAGLALRLPGRRGVPATLRLTALGAQARERLRSRRPR